jgi:hypothetical protein
MNLNFVRPILSVFVISLIGQQVCARVDYSKTQRLVLPDEVKVTDSAEAVNAILPGAELSGRSESQVTKQILDNSIRLIWRTSPLRYSSIGQAAQKVEKTVQVEKVIQSSGEENKVQHKFSFDIQGVQALAQLKYSGWVQAAIRYNARDASSSAEVSERIFHDKDLTLSQTVTAYEATSQVSLSWGW